MLGKLLKYEFKATSRIFIPLLLLLVILTPITKIMVSFIDKFKGFAEIIPILTTASYGMLIIAICVTAFIFMIYRFYKNLLTEEGYLMFTLPVSVHSLVLSKAIVAFFWTIVSYAASGLSFLVLIYSAELKDKFFYYYDMISKAAYAEMKFELTNFIVWTCVLMLISQIYIIFYAYCSIAIGQLSRHKILGAIAAAIVINITLQVVMNAVLIPFTISIDETNIVSSLTNLYLISAAMSIAITAVFYFITTTVLQKKLNLN